jgi:hypothetical protein
MMIHLRMSGRVLVAQPGAERPAHTHVILHLAPDARHEAQELWFVDPRTFGEVVVFDPAREASVVPELARLGIDPLVDDFTSEVLYGLLRPKRGSRSVGRRARARAPARRRRGELSRIPGVPSMTSARCRSVGHVLVRGQALGQVCR